METKQPIWKLIAQIGDASPLVYGGYWVFEDITGVYAPEAEKLIVPYGDGNRTAYRYSLDKLKLIPANADHGELLVSVKYNDSWPHAIHQYDEWFHDSLGNVANSNGLMAETLRDMFCSDDILERARAYEMLGEYHGFENLDGYPEIYAKWQASKRYNVGKFRQYKR